ncbi:hypothetical protein [Desulfitobacterium hafniense]|uniref:hypothetical protein n=1 Tax=Desulfitobacterium hafniense TaxID=49338 RepID=UPI00037E53BB|nr:hypothetical protein [Desulfitobacterium hafniense]
MNNVTTAICQKVSEWNNQCAQINTSLFLADSFNPKPIPANATAEMTFWYDITNLYALLSDCLPYVFKEGLYFNRTKISLNQSQSLLKILESCGAINSSDSDNLRLFFDAIKEARSCFCHNKPASTFNKDRIKKGLGVQNQSWEFFPHLTSVKSVFDYDEGCQIINSKIINIISILDKAIQFVCTNHIDIVDKWSKSIASWYMSSNDVIFRGLISYRNAGKIQYVKDGFSKMEKNSLETIAKHKRITIEQLIQSLHDDLTDTIIYHHQVATPENVLYTFFDSII